MHGLVGYVGDLQAVKARSLVDRMVAPLLRAPRESWGRYSVPELGLHAAWVSEPGHQEAPYLSRIHGRDQVALVCGDIVEQRSATDASRTGERAGELFEQVTIARDDDRLRRINGFFAALLVDRRSSRIEIVTDRFGIQRLYWADTPRGSYFASEAKALLQVLDHTRDFDPVGLGQYLTHGCIIPPRSLFRHISVVPPGARWTWSGQRWRRRHYFDPSEWESQSTLTPAEFEQQYADTFEKILPEYYLGEQPVGVALTGGLDTRMILACRPRAWEPPITYTYAGQTDTRDVVIARRLATACGIPHHVLRLDDAFFRDFGAHADRTIWETDGTLGVTGAHESFLSMRARGMAPVRLTGVFGGEVLRGVAHWRRLGLDPALLDPDVVLVTQQATRDATDRVHPVTTAAFQATPPALFGSLTACRSWLGFRTPFLDSRLVELAYRSPRATAATEQSAVRMLRQYLPPLPVLPTDRGRRLDGHRLTDCASRALGQIAFKLDYLSNDGLRWPFTHLDPAIDLLHETPAVLGQHKYLRYRRWFRQQLADEVGDRIERARAMPLWRPGSIQQMFQQHRQGTRNRLEELNAVLSLEALDRLLIRGTGKDSVAGLPTPSVPVGVPLTRTDYS